MDIYSSYSCYPIEHFGGLSLSQLPQGERQGGPQMGRQTIAGPTQRDR